MHIIELCVCISVCMYLANGLFYIVCLTDKQHTVLSVPEHTNNLNCNVLY